MEAAGVIIRKEEIIEETANAITSVQEHTMTVHKLTTIASSRGVNQWSSRGTLQYSMVIAEMDGSKIEFLEKTQNAKVEVVDMPPTVQVENRQCAGHEHKHMHGGLEEAARNDPRHSTVIPDHRTVG